MAELRVVDPGLLCLVQDGGRPGLASMGVGRSGAADRAAYRLANRLLANPEDAAALEVLFGGLELLAQGTVTVLVTGADIDVLVDGRRAGMNTPITVRDGQRFSLGVARAGLRAYVGVRGGVAVEPILGSRSRDTMAALGPPALSARDVVPVGPSPWALPLLDVAPVATLTTAEVTARVYRGPRAGCFDDPDQLIAQPWTVSDRTDRVGTRLEGHAIGVAADSATIPSEGAVRGAIQVPPNGEPIIFGPDHPVTGGYPVIGVVAGADLDSVAQLRPGQRLRLRWA